MSYEMLGGGSVRLSRMEKKVRGTKKA